VTKERDNENDEKVESPRKKVKTSENLKKKLIQKISPPAANRVGEKEISRNSSVKELFLCEAKELQSLFFRSYSLDWQLAASFLRIYPPLCSLFMFFPDFSFLSVFVLFYDSFFYFFLYSLSYVTVLHPCASLCPVVVNMFPYPVLEFHYVFFDFFLFSFSSFFIFVIMSSLRFFLFVVSLF
jgi:hypothetical protein